MANINDWDYKNTILTKIHADKMHKIMSANVDITFAFSKLTKYSKNLLIKPFERGYRLNADRGQVGQLTNLLCNHFDLPEFPIINGNGLKGIFFNPTNEKFLNEMKLFALLNELDYTLYSQHNEKTDLYMQDTQKWVNNPEAAKTLIEMAQRHDMFVPKEKRDEVLRFIKEGRIITFHKQFK